MAKKGKKVKVGGPFLAAAMFCENVLIDKDGTPSVIRAVDNIKIVLAHDTPPEIPSKEHPIPHQMAALLGFKSGDSPGKHHLKLVIRTMSGERKTALDQIVEFDKKPHGGVNIRTQITLLMTRPEGTYWLDVVLDGKRFTRMPLRVEIVREPKPGNSSGTTTPAGSDRSLSR